MLQNWLQESNIEHEPVWYALPRPVPYFRQSFFSNWASANLPASRRPQHRPSHAGRMGWRDAGTSHRYRQLMPLRCTGDTSAGSCGAVRRVMPCTGFDVTWVMRGTADRRIFLSYHLSVSKIYATHGRGNHNSQSFHELRRRELLKETQADQLVWGRRIEAEVWFARMHIAVWRH